MWDLPGLGHEPVSPALAGGFLTTAPPGKPFILFFNRLDNGKLRWVNCCGGGSESPIIGVQTSNWRRICKDVKGTQAWVSGWAAGLVILKKVSSNLETLISGFVFIYLHGYFIGLNIYGDIFHLPK